MNCTTKTVLRPRTPHEVDSGGGFALSLYRALSRLAGGLTPIVLRARAVMGKEDPVRRGERMGRSARERPGGTLFWLHAASVGESLSALPLITRLTQDSGRFVLVTTGTVTSARLMAERLPPRAVHQFVPVDTPAAVRAFLDHWRPDMAMFVESELWPNLLLETAARGVPMALVNARLSERSFRGWSRASAMARALLGAFDLALAQDEAIAKRLTLLGAREVRVAGNLKADTPPLPVDAAALTAFLNAAAGRRILLAASTHPGEDEMVLAAATAAKERGLDVFTVIVPRHPVRGREIETLALAKEFATAVRSRGDMPSSSTSVYIADTLGELGLFYRAADFAFLGGSLARHGGQNPLEPAQLGTAVLAGPNTWNFGDLFAQIFAAQGSGLVESSGALTRLAVDLLTDPARARAMGARARDMTQTLGGALERTVAAIEDLAARHARS